MSHRIILHCDMNAFFAAVEQQSKPALRGKPIGIIGSGARTIITTCSYEARAFGVKTGMTIYEARQRCPHIELVVGNNRKYTDTSTGIVNIFRDYTPLVEVFSIDESFLDLTGSMKIFGSVERIAMQIKARILHRYGITCSVGIAPNKLLAKLASEMQKPDGLTFIHPDKIAEVLEDMPVGELCGIGRQMQKRLLTFGITTCGELGRFSRRTLKKRFGIVGEKMHDMGRGIDDSPVVPSSEKEEVKSVGHSMTLPKDIDTREEICHYLLRLSEMVGRRARRYGVTGRTITLTVRDNDFETQSIRETGQSYSNRSDEIYQAVLAILNRFPLDKPIRLLGVRLSGLRHHVKQYTLFPDEHRKEMISEAMDEVNDRYGNFAVSYGSVLKSERGARVISPAWRPEGIRYVNVE